MTYDYGTKYDSTQQLAIWAWQVSTDSSRNLLYYDVRAEDTDLLGPFYRVFFPNLAVPDSWSSCQGSLLVG